ncbi:hypothetical protein ACFP3I_04330 [Chryseobacterium arachidis]|uniref:hypothetical protein n=1 Tax=Chryseobacterium arachidis TaxID=1416778 RepID=UPI00360DFB5B
MTQFLTLIRATIPFKTLREGYFTAPVGSFSHTYVLFTSSDTFCKGSEMFIHHPDRYFIHPEVSVTLRNRSYNLYR